MVWSVNPFLFTFIYYSFHLMVVDIAFIWVYFVAKYWKEITMYA
jgi:hypothetical protein